MSDRVLGVSLEQYAILIAGRDDDLPVEAVLSLAQVSAETWALAQEAWEERLLDDLDADGPLAEELMGKLAEARGRWARPLPPLDSDLRAWLDFDRAWAGEVDGEAFLARHSMRRADMARLHDLWSARLRDQPDLQRRALTILADEPGEPPVPRPEPATLRRSA